jgi:hypothetical protein
MTALHLSAYHGHGSVTKALVAAGADVSVRDHKGSVRPVRPVPYSILKYHLSTFARCILPYNSYRVHSAPFKVLWLLSLAASVRPTIHPPARPPTCARSG